MKNFSPLSRIRPSPTSLVSVRCYSQNNDGDNNSGSSNSCNSNKSLNLSFQGLIPKLLALEKVLLSNNGRREYIDLQMRGIFISTFQGLVLYSHLQNPLLKKYTFDVADFFAGARESVKLILELSGSTDFVEYAIGKPISSVTVFLLDVTFRTYITNFHILKEIYKIVYVFNFRFQVPESVKFIKQVLLNEDGNEPFKELLIGTRKFALFRSFCASGTVLPWMRIQEIKKLKIVQMVIDSISTRVVEKVEEEENDQQVKETKDKKIRYYHLYVCMYGCV